MRKCRFALLVTCVLCVVEGACTLGEFEEPGCRTDAECEPGRICRANACFRLVGEPASSAADGGLDGGDAG